VVNRGQDRKPIPLIALISAVLGLVGYRGHTAATLFEAWKAQLDSSTEPNTWRRTNFEI
jgi:hypothetical protein